MFISKKYELNSHSLELLAIGLFGNLYSGIIEKISLLKQSSINSKGIDKLEALDKTDSFRISSLSQMTLPPEKPKIEKKIKSFLLLLGVTVLQISGGLSVSLSHVFTKAFRLDAIQALRIVLVTVLYKLIFKTIIFRHQYFSLLLIFIGILISSIYPLIYNFKDIGFQYILLVFIEVVCYSLEEVGEKFIMQKKYFSPFILLFYEGCLSLIIFVILLPLLTFVPCGISEEGEMKENLPCIIHLVNFNDFKTKISNNKILILFLFLLTIISNLYETFRILTNYHFTPTHRIISDNIAFIILWFIDILINKKEILFHRIIRMIGYLIVLLGSLIFHEIINIHICNLDFYVREEIKNREYMESRIISEEEVTLEDNYESI